MKKILVILLACVFVVTLSVASFGLTSPALTRGHGVVTGMLETGQGQSSFILGGEYAILKDFGVGLGISSNTTKIYAKYELNPSVALTGGIYSVTGSSDPFLGINGGAAINKDFMILGELDVVSTGGQFVFGYEAGAKFNINKQFDIRGGVIGAFGNGSNSTQVELGVGFKF